MMKIKIAAFLVAWITIVPTFASAQNIAVNLSGKVTGADNKPLDGAAIYLLNGRDSALVKTALADASGAYSFKVKPGVYKLSVTMMGYKRYQSGILQLEQDKAMEPIILQMAGTALKEVSVSAQRPFVQQKIDRTIISPEALISNSGSTALEVLEKAPGVIVDQNAAISLQGKGVTIFIDDKPTYLSGQDLENYLRSLTAAAIDQIELMPNPPAKYDASGNGGVINIRTRKNKVKGFNGSLNLNYTQGRYAKTNNSLNFNYRNNRVNIFGNLSYNKGNGFSDLNINRHFENAQGDITSNFLQNSFIRRKSDNYFAKIGVDYYISDKSTFGINLTGIYNPYNTKTPVTSQFSNAANQPDSTIIAHNQEHGTFRNGGANLNYRHQFDKNGHEFSADLDYLDYYTNNNQLFNNSSFLPDGTLVGNEILTGMLPAHIHIYSAKTDYDHPLKNGLKLSTGLKSSYTHTDNIADYFYSTGGSMTPDYGKTNHFIYKENINAAYINATKDYKQLSVQAGLRLENTISNGHQLGNAQKPDSAFKRNYTNLFPTIYLQYKLDTANRNQLSLNYGRRIDRPYYQDLNPFLSPLDKFTYYTGNPFLRPTFTDNFELSHTYKSKFTTTLSYSRSRDDVEETIEIVDGIYYSRPGNIGTYTVKTLSFDGTFDPAKWFNFHISGRVSQIHSVSNFYTGLLDSKGTYFFVRPILTFKLPEDWTAQLDGGYQSKVTSAQFVSGSRGKVNAAVSKKLSPKTTLKLVVNDIFYTFKNTGVINNLNQTQANWRNLNDTRTGVLSLSYRFGKAISGQRQHDANGAESEQNRVKN
ncbi:TonB-dependent receptor [Mucilaginibacter endophyticus]|uniref:TonB-dependent receptor n=1 Tax=Mucilaginibacter endophyticus TaxID=2675003 RepID=UPI000E0D7A3F|nr:TonB-dependent receptor [Mucilaginibacter endophyticus]